MAGFEAVWAVGLRGSGFKKGPSEPGRGSILNPKPLNP